MSRGAQIWINLKYNGNSWAWNSSPWATWLNFDSEGGSGSPLGRCVYMSVATGRWYAAECVNEVKPVVCESKSNEFEKMLTNSHNMLLLLTRIINIP